MTEKTIGLGVLEEFILEFSRLVRKLEILSQPIPNLNLREDLHFLDQFMVLDSEETPIDFGEVIGQGSPQLLNDLSRVFGFKLTLDLKIQRNFNDHNSDFISGFVLNWTHQEEEYSPDRRRDLSGLR